MINNRRRNIYRILFVVLSPILFLLILELLSRLKYVPSQIHHDGLYEYHPNKVFTLKPNHTGYFSDHLVTTNSHGFRDIEFPISKPQNQFRILVLGDSITFGDGVLASQCFSEQLENLLHGRFPDQDFQVINSGVPGNSSMQEFYDLLHGLQFDPDMVLLQFTLNDITEPFIFLKRLGGSGWSYHGIRDIPAMDYYLGQRSALYSLAKNWYVKLTYQGEESDTLKERGKKQEIYQKEKLITQHDHASILEAWQEYLNWLSKIADTCRARELPLMILISPFEFQLPLPAEQDHPQMKLIEFCENRNISHLNLIDALRADFESQNLSYSSAAETEKFWDLFFHDHDHYSVFGHKFVAELLFPHIVGKLSLSN